MSCWRNSASTLCWIKSSRDVIELNVCRTHRCRTFGAWSVGTRRSSTTLTALSTLPLLVYEGMWTHSPPLIVMHLLDRSCMSIGNFWNCMLRFPAKVLQSGFYWPTLFKDAHKFILSCDEYQRIAILVDIRKCLWIIHLLLNHLMFGALIIWDLFLALMGIHIF